ncbi:TetR/AcrR family transcriptional regulator [Aeromicrobium sp. CFBP 8757]|uniref:TetR/AcrR family transcriptional regulator n=1 Tax=Aeromicrobium sp. CFBP 8757 TaxID=2775288 RepID=UPI0017853CEB|nr:TetR/AcrR family transcriptional regulator [Aeromicrobium sp. CFBP 8757]
MPATTDRPTDTRTAVVDAAARLLGEHGASAVTTRRVADEAGVQAPTIYRIFGDKDGLLEAVAEHVMATYVSAKARTVEAATSDDVDPVDDLRAGWDTQIDFGLANPMLFRFMNDPTRALTSPATLAGLDVLRARVHRMAVTGRLRVAEERAVDLIRAAGVGAVTTILATPPEQRDRGLADAMLDAVLGQMLTDEPAAAQDDSVSVAVAMRAMAPQLEALSEAERRLLAEWLDRVVDQH